MYESLCQQFCIRRVYGRGDRAEHQRCGRSAFQHERRVLGLKNRPVNGRIEIRGKETLDSPPTSIRIFLIDERSTEQTEPFARVWSLQSLNVGRELLQHDALG